jgi:hypothetical protein
MSLNSNLDNLRIIEVDCAYEQLENSELREVFANLLCMRRRGYTSRHPTDALPVDTYDFIGTQYLMVEEKEGKFHFLGGVRMVSLKRANQYNLPLPIFSLMNSVKADRHVAFLEQTCKISDSASSAETQFTYVSSWTFTPEARANPELTQKLHQVFLTINVFSHRELKNQVRIALGIPRLKTDLRIQWMGYERATDASGQLPPVMHSGLSGEPVVLLSLPHGHSSECSQEAELHAKLWHERLVFKVPAELNKQKVA